MNPPLAEEGQGAVQVVRPAQHRHAVNMAAMPFHALGQDADDGIGPLGLAVQLPHKRLDTAGLAHHDDRHRGGRHARMGGKGLGRAAVGIIAGQHARRGQQQHHQEEGQDRAEGRRSAQLVTPDGERPVDQNCGEQRRPCDHHRIGQGGVTPDRPVQPVAIGHESGDDGENSVVDQ